jgi:spore maturation protein CgeB
MNLDQKALLSKNLEAISSVSQILEDRIRWPVETNHLSFNDQKQPVYLNHREWFTYLTAPNVVAADISSINEESHNITLFGIGFGEYIEQILSSGFKGKITVWERDPALLRTVMQHHDYSDHIKSGKLKIVMGCDLYLRCDLLDLDNILYHPFFSRIYYIEQLFLEKRLKDKPVAILALGKLFFDDLAQTLNDKGYTVWPVDLQKWSVEELQYTVAALNPKFLASINYIDGAAEFCERLQLPFFCWEIDPNMDIDIKLDTSSTVSHIFTYRKKNLHSYKSNGFVNVEHLPLASNINRRKPYTEKSQEDLAKYQVPIAYVGASMAEEARFYRSQFVELYGLYKSGDPDASSHCEMLIQNILDKQLQDTSRHIIPELFSSTFGQFRTFLAEKKLNFNSEKVISFIAAAERRLHYVASLGNKGIHVWGDVHWHPVKRFKAKYRGPAGHHHELPKIYSLADINIDIGRIYQLDIVTMRVFDVLACGGFLIAEHNDELADFFEIGVELESYASLAELHDKVDHYLKNPDQRETIAKAGLDAVKKRHTFSHRIDYVLSKMNM